MIFGFYSVFGAQLSHRRPSFVEDQAVHIVGEVGERDLSLGALNADGTNEHAHLGFLLREHMLDASANL